MIAEMGNRVLESRPRSSKKAAMPAKSKAAANHTPRLVVLDVNQTS
jgi:hypothetical protein